MDRSKQILAEFTQGQFRFLRNFEERCDGSGISTASIVCSVLRLLEKAEVDLRGVDCEDQLYQRLMDGLKETVVTVPSRG